MSDTTTQHSDTYDPRQTIRSAVIPPLAWAFATLVNSTVVAFISPFIVPNLIVILAGGYDDLPQWFFDPSAVLGPLASGAAVGLLTWLLARPGLTQSAAESPRRTILVFSFSGLLAAAGIFMLEAVFLTAHPLFCAGGPLLWTASIALPTIMAFKTIRILRRLFEAPSQTEPHA